MQLAAGASFARYKVEGSLGDGGMGHVYRAFDTQLHRHVALKLLNVAIEAPPSAASPAAELLLREARAAAALNHANAVTVFEVGEHDGVPFMAMELVEGRSLRHWIGRPGVPLARRLGWLFGVASALSAAHAAGIVHLDVKPENVIIREDDVAKVLDFGIARRRSFDPELTYPERQDAEKIHHLTGGGAIAGTPRYMAPEQIGRLPLDGRTDQFAWGVVAYEVLTGRNPWPQGDDLYSLFYAIVHEGVPPLARVRSDVPDAVSALVARAMSKMRDDRFQSMKELCVALAGAMEALQIAGRASVAGGARSTSSPSEAPTLRGADAETIGDDASSDATVEIEPTGPADPKSRPISLPAIVRGDTRRSSDDGLSLPGLSRNAREAAAAVIAAGGSAFGGSVDDRASSPASERSGSSHKTQRSERAPTPVAPAKGPSRIGRALAGASVLATAMIGTWIAAGRTSAPPSTGAPPSITAVSTTSAIAPSSVACNEAATRAYTAGSRALRNGDWEQARKSFADAAAADAECAPAHARLVVMGYWMDQPSKTRESMRRAVELKARLTDRDQALLKCYEHVLWSTPPDDRAFAACLEQLSEKDPKDAELAYIASDFAPDPNRQRELAQRALDIDPEYSDAWQGVAVALERLDDEAGALAALDKCVARVTTSMDCLAQRAQVLRHMGRCTELEATGRKWIARSPEASGAHYTLGSALASEERPRAVVEEALAPRWARLKGTDGARNEPLERAALAALWGDFAGAEQHVRAMESLAKDGTDVEPRVDAALWRIDLGLEAGKLDDVGKLAKDLWDRKAAWDPGARRVGFNVKVEAFEPSLLRALKLTKRMPDAEWAAARTRWEDDAKFLGTLDAEARWVLGYAMQIATPEEADAAIKSMPPSIVSSMRWTTKLPGQLLFAYAGRALFLSGRLDEGARLLGRAASSCAALEEPMLHTTAQLWFAEALEAKGDKAGACSALAKVARRWPAAASRTGRLAAEKSRALGCAP